MAGSSTVRHCVVFIAAMVAVCALHWGQSILVPLVLAVLLMDLLTPAVDQMRSWRIPDAMGVALVTAAVALVVLAGLILVSRQVYSLSGELPNYRDNLVTKVRALHGHGGVISRLIGTVTAVSSELSPAEAATTTRASRPATQPVQVEVVKPRGEAVSVATGMIAPVIFPLTQFGIMLTYLFFMLLNRELIARRVRWLMNEADVGIGGYVFDDASRRVGRYLWTQLLVNGCYAIAAFIVLWLFGVPHALLLAVIAAALRYVPYIGPIVGFSLPTLLSVAVFPGWWRSVGMLGCLVSVEALTASILEPMVYGNKTGVSSIGVVLATFFWGWVWGPVGLVLALPITVWLVIVGRHIPALQAISTLLSADPQEGGKASMSD